MGVVHFGHVHPDALARIVALGWDLLGARHDRLSAA